MRTARIVGLLALVASGCRTWPLEGLDAAGLGDAGQPAPDAAQSSQLDLAGVGGFVSCGPGLTCSIAAGEHCCDQVPLTCQAAPCMNANQYDCDGPEDCAGGVCCFPIRNAFTAAACVPSCGDGTVLCHARADCPSGTVCCLNFVLGPNVGLCLGACD